MQLAVCVKIVDCGKPVPTTRLVTLPKRKKKKTEVESYYIHIYIKI